DLRRPQYAPQTLYSDNQGAIALVKNPQFHARMKHIDIQVHFIRQCVNEGKIQLKYCEMGEMVADVMTKALGRIKHEKFMEMMGMAEMEEMKEGKLQDDDVLELEWEC